MRRIFIIIIFQVWHTQVVNKPTKPCAFAAHPSENSTDTTPVKSVTGSQNTKAARKQEQVNARRNAFYHYIYGAPVKFYGQITGPQAYGELFRQGKSTATTTTRVLLDNDCDYINYYCMRGYYTGKLCAKTIYQTYASFNNYCELEYVNCLEQYDMWSIAHMGYCYNVSYFQTFAYYSYATWDDEQLEEMYVMPNA